MTNPPESATDAAAPGFAAAWLLVLAAVAVPLSLLWDVSWEFTVGVETAWAPPHLATYAAMAVATLAALALVFLGTRGNGPGIRLGRLRAPLGVWLVVWGGLAYGTAVIFDRWWQGVYGLAAGIWHPPQLLKAAGFFAVLVGTWLFAAGRQKSRGGAWAFAATGGAVLAMIFIVTLPANFANRQHSAVLYQAACGTYPIVLVAAALGGRLRYPATSVAFCFMLIVGAAVWLLPLQAAHLLAGPIFKARDHLLPPPFPLLLVGPAVALDLLLRVFPGRRRRGGRSLEAALAFFLALVAVQWPFASFLLSPAAENWFFGGGVPWPPVPDLEFNVMNAAIAMGLAVMASALGMWIGERMDAQRKGGR